MICRIACSMLIRNPEPIFKIVGKNLIAGYRESSTCIYYFLNWSTLVDGEIESIYIPDIPIDYKVLNGCKKIVIIGSFENPKLHRNWIILDLNKKEIYGFLNFRFHRIMKTVLEKITIKDIMEEIEEIYGRVNDASGDIPTWYPLIN